MNTIKLPGLIKGWIKRFTAFITPSGSTIKGASRGIIIVSVLVHFAANIELGQLIGYHYWAVFLLTVLLLAFLSGLLIDLIAGWLASIARPLKVALVIAGFVSMFSFALTQQTGLFVLASIIVFSSLAGAGAWLLIKGHWKNARIARKIMILMAGITGVAGLTIMTWWVIQPGKAIDPPVNAAMQSSRLPEHLQLANPSAEGDYTVLHLTYGSGKDTRRPEFGEQATLLSHSVDGSVFLDTWDGWRGNLRTKYFGFGKDSLPLNGLVWYPDNNERSPLVLVVHGNHLAQDYSDPGYEYLGSLLASRGFIVASVDQNFINSSFTNIMKGFSGENDARGWLLLKHLELWKQWNADTTSPFFGKVDMDRIALIGHSRGGEAVGHAALFNRLPHYPDKASETFDFHFNIRSIIAIAPVDGQYQPAGIHTPFKDINYFVIHGSHDADMQSFHGQRQFERVKFSDDFEGFKAGLYVFAANHGQFNSVWGRKDFFSPRINFYNLRQLMSKHDQETIARVAISAFLEATLRDKPDYQVFFMDYRSGRDWLPETIYLNQFESSGTRYICRFDEDLDLTTTSLDGGSIETENLTVWREKLVPLTWGNLGSRAVYIGWNTTNDNTPSYSIHIPEGSMGAIRNKMLVFSLADANEDPGEHDMKNTSAETQDNTTNDSNETVTDGSEESRLNDVNEDVADDPQENMKNGSEKSMLNDANQAMTNDPEENKDDETEDDPDPIDFTIELVDAAGGVIQFGLSDCKFLQPAISKKMGKLPFIKTAADSEIVFDFFYFPLGTIMYNASMNDRGEGMPAFDPERLVSIRIILDRTEKGVIILNNLGFVDDIRHAHSGIQEIQP
jgi:hypothetical protein